MKNKSEKYNVIGIMSGSSLDGVDLAYCEFILCEGSWQFKIVKAKTFPYKEAWKEILTDSTTLSGKNLIFHHIQYGGYLGELAKVYIQNLNLKVDFIASHGHTVFHSPNEGYTFQLGEGQAIANKSGLPVICDFRTKDIQNGGQGAPLVPIGDHLLFPGFDICLNLGGIANLSFVKNNFRLAFDICPANQVLNNLAQQLNHEFDDEGKIASNGKINSQLLEELNQDSYYQQKEPKSLSNDYVRFNFIDKVNRNNDSIPNKMRTVVEHIVFQINKSTENLPAGKLLVTGGGAKNGFLIQSLKRLSKHSIVVPDDNTIDFKEALIFAFLGVLSIRNEVNCLASVTGATHDCSSGVVFYP